MNLKKLQDQSWIDDEADFVDEVILLVGKRKNTNRALTDSFSREFVLLLANLELQQPLAPATPVTPEGWVEFAGNLFTGLTIPQNVLTKYNKDAETSRLLLNRGTELYQLRDFHGALHYYNSALIFAQKGTQSVGFAHANRSAVLVELGRFEEALQEVDSALKNNYPEARVEKLKKRSDRCQKSIQQKHDEYLAMDAQVRKDMEAEMQKMRNIRDEMLKVEKSNPLMPAAADFVEIKYDTAQGRHLVVNQDVPAGTPVIVEDPYMFTLYGQSKWDTQHCHHCLKRTWNGIPCPNCTFAIYCNESCQLEAKRFHEYECQCLPSLHAINTVKCLHEAIRIVCKVGPQELFRIFQTKDPEFLNPKEPFGTAPNCVYDSKSYLSVFHLESHPEKGLFRDRGVNTAYAIMATQILQNHTRFFEDIPPDRMKEFKIFLATTILCHSDADRINAGVVNELRGLDNMSFVDGFCGKSFPGQASRLATSIKSRAIAGAIYPVVSLMNHSCDPNVSPLGHTTNGRVVVVADRTLEKGEPLYVTYNSGFTRSEIQMRQAYVERIYHFKCRCIACKLNWPIMSGLLDQKPIFCCPTCSKTVFEHDKGSGEFKKCLLAHPRWKCGSCGKIYKEMEMRRQLEIKLELAKKIIRLLDLYRPTEAYETFLKVSDYFQFHFCPPNGTLYFAQDLFRQVMFVIFHFAEERL